MLHAAKDATPTEGMLRITAASGELKWIRLVARPRTTNGEPVWDGLLLDVTASVKQTEENKTLEARLRQAQKLESLGTLAGGIAHEFNNMLVPISGLTELAMRDVAPDTRAHNNMRAVLLNSRRAAQLVEKILSFARQEDSGRTAVDLGTAVAEAAELLGATSPATIRIRTHIDRDVGAIYAGEVQIHQILMNLASNARHAMEGRVGEMTISVARVDFARPFEGRYASLKPGSYAKLSVKDTGHGMDAATMERIFEPFFTTKDVGKGTGLGLAVIHGIVSGHGGGIDVTSAPGVGTTFDIYFPLIEAEAPVQAVA
jgi:signal transduction histidine kinase